MIDRLLVLRPVSVHVYGHPFRSYCWNLTRIQAIDLFFSMKVHGLTEYKLTDTDWELLDTLYAVLAVSYSDSDLSIVGSTRCTGSSYGSASHVSRIDASALRSCSIFRDLHDPMGKTPCQVPGVETLGQCWLTIKWAKKYYTRMDNTDAYVVAMCEFLPSFLSNLNVNCSQSSILASVSSGSLAIGEEVMSSMLKPWLSSLWVLSCN